nr:hypothetical protein CFP56_75494 [Quercus suber]
MRLWLELWLNVHKAQLKIILVQFSFEATQRGLTIATSYAYSTGKEEGAEWTLQEGTLLHLTCCQPGLPPGDQHGYMTAVHFDQIDLRLF